MKSFLITSTMSPDLLTSNNESNEKVCNASFDSILLAHGVKFTKTEYYWQIGEMKKTQGWIIHLSAVLTQLSTLIELIIPLLLEQSIVFKIIQNPWIANLMLDGDLGYVNVGKMISIYPTTDEEALKWAKRLIQLTANFRGPRIPTDLHLGSIVYVRYGSFQSILATGPNSHPQKCIYDSHGRLIPDPCSIPFSFPKDIFWPFSEITSSMLPTRPKLLNNAYYPLQVLKSDAKGEVSKGIYFKKLWQIKTCLIKQGRWNMTSDLYGRDIQDRLQWQYDLYRQLNATLPLPVIFDYFRQQNDSYLAMEYISGATLLKWVNAFYKHQTWFDLLPAIRLALLNMFQQVVDIIHRLHKQGYVHRDITPENFLIDRKGTIYLIDLELTWNIDKGLPDPPFTLGSPGFMSPQQQAQEKPTLSDDIFGLGSLLLFFVTNMLPEMFCGDSPNRLYSQILFFTGNERLANVIVTCRQKILNKRPPLFWIRQQIQYVIKSTENETKLHSEDIAGLPSKSATVKNIIQSAVNGLAHPRFLCGEGLWVSQIQDKDKHIDNVQLGKSVSMGWFTGTAGPLWLLARAKSVGFSIEECMSSYTAGWAFIRKKSLSANDILAPGLYTGSSGIAVALAEGLHSGLLMTDKDLLNCLLCCLSGANNEPTLASGWAGQVLALLCSSPWLDKHLTERLLHARMEKILETQRIDGAWNTFASNKKDSILTGINVGVAGICWSLLNYLDFHYDLRIEAAVQNALSWLIKIRIEKKGICGWPVSTRTRMIDPWSIGQGTPGTLLVLIKAFEKFKTPQFREVAEQMLKSYTPRPQIINLTLGSGLTGLGELYLEAFRVFKNPEWKKRADWIAQVLLNLFQVQEQESGYWYTGANNTSTADLLSGNSGIIHFLLRYDDGGKLGHPLSAISRENNMRIRSDFSAENPDTGEAENL